MKRNVKVDIKNTLTKMLLSTLILGTTIAPFQTYAASFAASPAAQESYAGSDKTYMPQSTSVNYKVVLNNNPINLGAEILNVGGSTMLPLRATAKALGVDETLGIGWDSTYKTAMVQRNTNQVEVVRGSSDVVINKTLSNQKLAQKMFITESGTSYLPLRGIAEALDVGIKWESTSQTIYIDTTKTYAQSDSIEIPSTPVTPGKEDQRQNVVNYLKKLNPNITDAQLEQSLSQIHLAPNGDGSGTATNEQESHYYKWHKEAVQGTLQGKYSEPNTKGDYVGEIRGTYYWDGESWTENLKLYTGMSGLIINA